MKTVYCSASLVGNRQQNWEALINELYTSLDINIPDQPRFFGRITHLTVGSIELTEILTDQERAIRTRRHISRDTKEAFFYLLPIKGSVQITQFDHDERLTPGHYALLDLSSPYTFQHSERIELLGIKIPGAPLYSRVADPHRYCGITKPAYQGISKVTADFMKSIRSELDSVEAVSTNHLASTIIDLIGLTLDDAIGDGLPTNESATHIAIHRRAIAYINVNLCNPKLDPDTIASAVGISVRHLHRMFRNAGESVCEVLRKRRLQKCHIDLLDLRKKHLPIAEIAYRNGFANACYFSDAFKAEFGASPRDVRNRENILRQEP